MRIVCLIGFLVLWFFSCDDEPSEDIVDITQIEDMFIGSWLEYAPCDSCMQVVFLENGQVEQVSRFDDMILSMSYSVVSQNSIEVVRDWEFLPELNGKPTSHKFIFHTPDTLEILQLIPVAYGVTGFQDIQMVKISR